MASHRPIPYRRTLYSQLLHANVHPTQCPGSSPCGIPRGVQSFKKFPDYVKH
ncbi:hypothetical protein L873DRAFT_1815273 [Choiromyces venosus 120613-1]|uniref:Uncharacterized protein n=1 Tax=Choiromyces venosus 120613-1 TaxID=1336337 RepID=A0A3N4IUE4_9PEZI|nr:hypothetical protein L873DRAFT_1824574 [Choiromyces venosus 120613-1]RPA93925.1 hypothetical protein L873DRAFT_1815273 [Choiromyces venosus 120613-1]